MDPAHGPFVHRAWWWRSAASIHEKTKTFEPLPNGFRMSAHAPSSNSAPYKLLGKPVTTIDFTLPNRRYETIRAEKRTARALVFLAHHGHAGHRVDLPHRCDRRVGHRVSRPIHDIAGRPLLRREASCEQDQQTMIEQARGLRSNPAPYAHRRRGQAREVVLRAQAAADSPAPVTHSAGRAPPSCTGAASCVLLPHESLPTVHAAPPSKHPAMPRSDFTAPAALSSLRPRWQVPIAAGAMWRSSETGKYHGAKSRHHRVRLPAHGHHLRRRRRAFRRARRDS